MGLCVCPVLSWGDNSTTLGRCVGGHQKVPIFNAGRGYWGWVRVVAWAIVGLCRGSVPRMLFGSGYCSCIDWRGAVS